jgi:UDP-glucose 4-epimerase
MKYISVIGATSPLGIDLVHQLAGLGYRVRATFRSAGRIPKSWQDDPLITSVPLDLGRPGNMAGFIQPVVIWLAHLDQGRFNENEVEKNLSAFEAFLAQAASSQVEKIIFVSSGGSVYGETRNLPIVEGHPRQPLSSYGKAKAAMEQRLFDFGSETGIGTAILRPGNIYGFSDPNNDHKGIVAAFLNAIRTRQPFTLIHEGRTVRDFIDVDDVCRAIAAAVESEKDHLIWNVATGSGLSIADLIAKVIGRSGFEMPEVRHIENFSSDVSSNVLSIKRITSESDWRPTIGIDEGIRKLLARRSGR